MGGTDRAPPFPSLTKRTRRQCCQTERKALLPGFCSAPPLRLHPPIATSLPGSNTQAPPDAEEASLLFTALHRQSAKLYGTRSSRRYYARARTRGSSATPVRAVPPSISRGRPREPCGSWREELCEGRFRRCCAVWSASFPPFSSCSFTQRSLLTLNTQAWIWIAAVSNSLCHQPKKR